MSPSVDYSLYLVTGRGLLPPGMDYYVSLEQALNGGVTVVQLREKDVETAEFLQIAQRSKSICSRYNVPLIINDRIDVALAIGADGVHLGQSDMPIAIARKLLPPGTIVGISCNNIEHVRKAVEQGADYVGIGAVWGTPTKDVTGKVIGVRQVGKLLQILDGTTVKAVGIGGIKSTNALRTLYGAVSVTGHAFDGIAVISNIMASSNPRAASSQLAKIVKTFKQTHALSVDSSLGVEGRLYDAGDILKGVGMLLDTVRKRSPLVHQITNTVVQTQSANATLALGASPIMSTAHEEMEDLGAVVGSVLVNIGTLRDENREGMKRAGFWANLNKKPVVLDPVGVGASTFRKEVVEDLLNNWQASVIKGNAGELAALAQSEEVEARGVDSVGSGFRDPVAFVKALAQSERCPVVMTGRIDYICDASGQTVVSVKNGHEMLGRITGAGCMVGTAVAVFCAGAASNDDVEDDGRLVRGDMFLGAIGGVLAVTISAELAMDRVEVNGPGTFLPALLDELSRLTPEVLGERANIEIVR